MMITQINFLNFLKVFALACFVLVSFSRCSDDDILETPAEDLPISAAAASPCNCTYTVSEETRTIDGQALNLKPGSVICLSAGVKYKNLQFKNLAGSAAQPIIITNCGGTANIVATGLSYGIKFSNCKYFRVTGGNTPRAYGIKVINGQIGMSLEYLSTRFEVDHIEMAGAGFAGIMAKTDPSCDNATTRDSFVMSDVSLHDNFVHDTGGEGFYIGNSFFRSGMNTPCGIRYPHEIHYLKVYNNVVKNSGWEGIQIGCATKGADVHDNYVENYGTADAQNQNNGIQIGEGTGGLFYNNFIKNGKGNGLIMLGLGDNTIYNNIIVGAGGHGIFCDERYTPGPGFKFINNTIVNPKLDGIRLYSELVPMNMVINNIIVNPGSYGTYKTPKTGDDSFLYKLSTELRVKVANNYFARSMADVKFANPAADNYRLTGTSPAINKGASISVYSIAKDFYQQVRLKGAAYDIGASEY